MSRLSKIEFDGGLGLENIEICGVDHIKGMAGAINLLSQDTDEMNNQEINAVARQIVEVCNDLSEALNRFIGEARAADAQ